MSAASPLEDTLKPLRILGIDPGPTPGLVELRYADGVFYSSEILQCTAGLFSRLFAEILIESTWPTIVAVEEFVVGPRAAKSGHAGAGAETRRILAEVKHHAERAAVPCLVRNASSVKLWATDERLEAAGLLEATKGMRHAKDAARHALFAAVRDGGVTDPLSRKARA